MFQKNPWVHREHIVYDECMEGQPLSLQQPGVGLNLKHAVWEAKEGIPLW